MVCPDKVNSPLPRNQSGFIRIPVGTYNITSTHGTDVGSISTSDDIELAPQKIKAALLIFHLLKLGAETEANVRQRRLPLIWTLMLRVCSWMRDAKRRKLLR